MRKIYHIGLHKTGSTSLQWFLQVNQSRLARSGILYPPTTPRGLARMLATGADRMDTDAASDINDIMGHNALAYRLLCEARPEHGFPPVHDPMLSGFIALEIIDQTAKLMQANTLIFCSEDLARLALHAPDALTRLKTRFGEDDVHLICTLRRPDDAIDAWQSQRLKGGAPTPRLTDSGIAEELASVHVAYADILENWGQHFPTLNLSVTPYAQTLTQGGAIPHFISTSGLALPKGLQTPANRNIGLHPALFDIARLGNAALNRRESYFLRKWLTRVQTDLTLPKKSDIEFLGAKNRTHLSRAFAPIHKRLSNITGQTPFFTDIDDMARCKPITTSQAAKSILTTLQTRAASDLPPSPHHDFMASLKPNDIP